MSVWRLVTFELYERGPLRTAQLMTAGDTARGLHDASQRGLVKRMADSRWCVTTLGVALATRRIVFRVPFVGGEPHRQKGTTLRPVATWLSALPYANEIRLSQVVDEAADDGIPDELIGELLVEAGLPPGGGMVTAPVLRSFACLLVARKEATR